jgi:hypothetical protein
MLAALAVAAAPADRVRVTLDVSDAGLRAGGGDAGRMIVFLAADGALPRGTRPCDAPFFESPQPMMSVAVERLEPGTAVVIDDGAVSFPRPLGELRGRFSFQAVFDRDRSERTHHGVHRVGRGAGARGAATEELDRVGVRLPLDASARKAEEQQADREHARIARQRCDLHDRRLGNIRVGTGILLGERLRDRRDETGSDRPAAEHDHEHPREVPVHDMAELVRHHGAHIRPRHPLEQAIGEHHAPQSGQHAHDRRVGDEPVGRPDPDLAHADARIARERGEIVAQLALRQPPQPEERRHKQRHEHEEEERPGHGGQAHAGRHDAEAILLEELLDHAALEGEEVARLLVSFLVEEEEEGEREGRRK